MNKKVFVTLRKQKWEVEPGQTAHQVILALDLDPDQFLIIRNGKIEDADARLEAGDHLRLAAIISGGSQRLISEI